VVHSSLAEFDLAFKAFDSYVDIVTRTKDRSERSGEQDSGLDSDDIIIRTAAEAVRILCRFGTRKEAEKAREVASTIEKWLNQPPPAAKLVGNDETSSSDSSDVDETTASLLAPRTLAVAYKAIGMSLAHWARLTYEASARAGFQSQAVQFFKRALDPKYEDPQNLETMYSLGLVLAETRDLVGAIKLIKQALLPIAEPNSPISPDGVISDHVDQPESPFARERQLVPLWHLLALLLTARSEYATAAKFCEAAFEQFLDPTNLFGSSDIAASYKSSHLNALEKSNSNKGLVDRMLNFEKENILQIKMTQLSLIEALEGPSAAVDASDELLALFARLFGYLTTEAPSKKNLGTTARPPKTSGTIRSSIFSRSKSTRKPSEGRTTVSSIPERPATTATNAPTIQVTSETVPVPERPKTISEKSKSPPAQHGLFRSKSASGSTHRRTGSSTKLRKKSISSIRTSIESDLRSTTNGAAGKDPSATNGENTSPELVSAPPVPAVLPPTVPEEDRRHIPEPELRPIAHNMKHDSQPPPAGHLRQPPVQDVRLPPPFPRSGYSSMEPRLPEAQERRHKVSLLVHIWLFISSMYCRAGSYDDARGAIDEATKLVKAFETEVARTNSTAMAFSERGWGGGKSVDELWADVWAEVSLLTLSNGLIAAVSPTSTDSYDREANSPSLNTIQKKHRPALKLLYLASQIIQPPSLAFRICC
jgi:cargo-transport protein YPP1